jgi:hypothetical protein
MLGNCLKTGLDILKNQSISILSLLSSKALLKAPFKCSNNKNKDQIYIVKELNTIFCYLAYAAYFFVLFIQQFICGKNAENI